MIFQIVLQAFLISATTSADLFGHGVVDPVPFRRLVPDTAGYIWDHVPIPFDLSFDHTDTALTYYHRIMAYCQLEVLHRASVTKFRQHTGEVLRRQCQVVKQRYQFLRDTFKRCKQYPHAQLKFMKNGVYLLLMDQFDPQTFSLYFVQSVLAKRASFTRVVLLFQGSLAFEELKKYNHGIIQLSMHIELTIMFELPKDVQLQASENGNDCMLSEVGGTYDSARQVKVWTMDQCSQLVEVMKLMNPMIKPVHCKTAIQISVVGSCPDVTSKSFNIPNVQLRTIGQDNNFFMFAVQYQQVSYDGQRVPLLSFVKEWMKSLPEVDIYGLEGVDPTEGVEKYPISKLQEYMPNYMCTLFMEQKGSRAARNRKLLHSRIEQFQLSTDSTTIKMISDENWYVLGGELGYDSDQELMEYQRSANLRNCLYVNNDHVLDISGWMEQLMSELSRRNPTFPFKQLVLKLQKSEQHDRARFRKMCEELLPTFEFLRGVIVVDYQDHGVDMYWQLDLISQKKLPESNDQTSSLASPNEAVSEAS